MIIDIIIIISMTKRPKLKKIPETNKQKKNNRRSYIKQKMNLICSIKISLKQINILNYNDYLSDSALVNKRRVLDPSI